MLKKINSKQLRVGMYINDLNCNWLKHPFANNRFKIEAHTDIQKIIEAGIKEVEIDIDKGIDVFVEKRKPENAELRNVFNQKVKPAIVKTTVQQELAPAQAAFSEAGEFITQMMADVKMGQQVELEKVNPIINKMSASILRNPSALLGLSRIRKMDKYTFEHSVSFAVLMMSFAKFLDFPLATINSVGIGGLLHDIGKTLTPNEILNKPGKLSDAEFMLMKEHVVHSRHILEKTKGLSQISLDVAVQHHEKYDGSGYPQGLKGEQISIYGQMAAVVDVYDALTADRCYHEGKEPSEVLKLLLKWSGAHFNPTLVLKFIQAVGIYPAGSLVLLSNHCLATVVDINENMLKPQVEIFIDAKKRCYLPRKLINLAEQDDLKIVSIESHAKWNLKH